jgi:hypothetical protein
VRRPTGRSEVPRRPLGGAAWRKRRTALPSGHGTTPRRAATAERRRPCRTRTPRPRGAARRCRAGRTGKRPTAPLAGHRTTPRRAATAERGWPRRTRTPRPSGAVQRPTGRSEVPRRPATVPRGGSAERHPRPATAPRLGGPPQPTTRLHAERGRPGRAVPCGAPPAARRCRAGRTGVLRGGSSARHPRPATAPRLGGSPRPNEGAHAERGCGCWRRTRVRVLAPNEGAGAGGERGRLPASFGRHRRAPPQTPPTRARYSRKKTTALNPSENASAENDDSLSARISSPGVLPVTPMTSAGTVRIAVK